MSNIQTKGIRLVAVILALLVFAAALASCGSSSGNDSDTTAAEGGATVMLEADPNPLVTNQEAVLTIQVRDASGNGVLGANVGLVAEHADMSMGKQTGIVRDTGGGAYTTTITPTMAGTWKVTVTADVEGTTKQASFELEVK